jgi:hypothetical protein
VDPVRVTALIRLSGTEVNDLETTSVVQLYEHVSYSRPGTRHWFSTIPKWIDAKLVQELVPTVVTTPVLLADTKAFCKTYTEKL